jgi:hypothetical protein
MIIKFPKKANAGEVLRLFFGQEKCMLCRQTVQFLCNFEQMVKFAALRLETGSSS